MDYGYARVSTDDQETALQRAALHRAGVARVVEEKRSGVASRPVLEALLNRLKPGDVLVVYKVDRLARSLVNLLHLPGSVFAGEPELHTADQKDAEGHADSYVQPQRGRTAGVIIGPVTELHAVP